MSWFNGRFRDILSDIKTMIFNDKMESPFFDLPPEPNLVVKLVSSEEFKFWFKMGLSTAGLILSFYSIYKIIKLSDFTSTSKSDAKQQGEKLLKKLGIETKEPLNNYELCLAANIVDCQNLSTEWTDIGGLEKVIEELKTTVLEPIINTDKSIKTHLYKTPKGVLLYGPPGCGKTMVVRALAKHSTVRFLNLKVTAVMDMYVGESEKHIEAIFTLAAKIQPVIIFIDEIDGLLSARTNSTVHEVFISMKTLFMSLWDGIMSDDNAKILIIGASNRPNSIDVAIMRRLQVQIEIKLPNLEQRKKIFKVILRDESFDREITDEMYEDLAHKTYDFMSSTIQSVCQDAVTTAVYNYKLKDEKTRGFFQLTIGDIYRSIEKRQQSSKNLRYY